MSLTSSAKAHATLRAIDTYSNNIARKAADTQAVLAECTALEERLFQLRLKGEEYDASLAVVRRPKRKRENDSRADVSEDQAPPSKVLRSQKGAGKSDQGSSTREAAFWQYVCDESTQSLFSSRRKETAAPAAPSAAAADPPSLAAADKGAFPDSYTRLPSLVAERDAAEEKLKELDVELTTNHNLLQNYASNLKAQDVAATNILRAAIHQRERTAAEVAAAERDVAAKQGELGKTLGPAWVASLGQGKKERPSLPAAMQGVRGGFVKEFIVHPEAGPSKRPTRPRGGGHDDVVPELCQIGGGM
ncbi:hypothetical protein B0H16DRAFT_1706128 [Mycena metata]|uniref:Uncharacterized protein n=1 Tax=Mycena metata TaxID=1033252 RepID=A0AAD7DUA9_9AGAR|nr:hypothetical protein B0H16DRAFT_1706128 [Mycena metata]